MNFNRVNNMVGWIVCLVACTVYVLTMEPTGSFWDCGEFVSTAYKVQIPHPPGAPLFVLLGRFFIILFGDDPANAARGVNFMNAIASGFTILFLFWTITHFARKMVQTGMEALTGRQLFITMAAGVVGALAYTFSDSFWYSAVEGEVYALSSLFTAIVFWAILKWEHEVDQESKTDGHRFSRADRWLIFIFYMMGLSIGVHLLNLLTIPAVVMVYYFKRYKVSRKGMLWAFALGCIITGLTQVAIIQWSIKGAGSFDIFFVNNLGMPFFSGFILYFILLGALLVIGLRFNDAQIRKFTGFPVWLSAIILLFGFPFITSGGTFALFALGLGAVITACYYFKHNIISFLKISLWCAIFVILGYTTYFTTLVRSNSNPSVDMYNVDNPVSLVGYLSREQYGDWPILYGPDFVYSPESKVVGDLYAKANGKYEVVGENRRQDFSAKPSEEDLRNLQQRYPDWNLDKIGPHIFPRMWDHSNERSQEYVYRTFGRMDQDEQPNFGHNIAYFVNYQFRWMYWRYFMWNFAGKQNDFQGLGNPRDGNWASGIPFIDRLFQISTPDVLPDTAGKTNKAYNKLFFLPLILGALGFFFHLSRNRRDWLIAFLLFFFTGFAIVIYLNQAGFQPRERDYAYVGSFYAFAIWIGLGVIWVREQLNKIIKGSVADYAAFGLCLLAVPILMASQEWDDHDRSKKTLGRDLGKDYLQSCDSNAVLITFGDNDTYPLWYAQEVEKVRPDLRVMNFSLLGTDWYINQLRYKVNQSPPADVIFTAEQLAGSDMEYVFTGNALARGGGMQYLQGFDQTKFHNLYDLLKNVTASNDPKYQVTLPQGDRFHMLPSSKVFVPVDVEKVRKTMSFNPGDSIAPRMEFEIKKGGLRKNDLAILALIAANTWERPIYFTSTQELDELGLMEWVRLEGLSYRLVPVKNQNNVELNKAYNNVMTKFAYGNANKQGIYFDEENRRHVSSLRQAHGVIANNLVNVYKKDSALKILHKYDDQVSSENIPYGMTSNRGNQHNRSTTPFLLAAYRAGDLTLARKIHQQLKKDLDQQMKYYQTFSDGAALSDEQLAMAAAQYLNGQPHGLAQKQVQFANDIYSVYHMQNEIADWKKRFDPETPAAGKPGENAPATLPTPPDSSGRPDTTKQ